jgi:hypothetical protein
MSTATTTNALARRWLPWKSAESDPRQVSARPVDLDVKIANCVHAGRRLSLCSAGIFGFVVVFAVAPATGACDAAIGQMTR